MNDARNFADDVDAKEAQINTDVGQLNQVLAGSNLMQEVTTSLDGVVKMQNARMRAKLIEVARASHPLHDHLSVPVLGEGGTLDE